MYPIAEQKFLIARKTAEHREHIFEEIVGFHQNRVLGVHRHKNLFEKIVSFENLLSAFYKARKGKRYKASVAAFEHNLEYELLRLQRELLQNTYRAGGHTTFKIYDPKERVISAAPFRDRVVHHALCNVTEPIFERSFIGDTYANRKGKGTHAAIRRAQSYMRQYKYVLKTDIRQYFPSIDHEVLKKLIAGKIGCSRTMALISVIIDNSGVSGKGLPIGNLTSQFWANVYLDGFDHFVKEELKIPGYVRYVDDFVAFADTKSRLHAVRQSMEQYMSERLQLTLHPLKTHITPTNCGLNFLGQRMGRKRRVILKTNLRRMQRRLRERLILFRSDSLHPDKLECQLNAWLGHARQADMEQYVRRLHNRLWFTEQVPIFRRENFVWKVLARPAKAQKK